MKKLLYFDLEHGSQTLGSGKDINNLFGYPELEPSTFGEFQDIIKQLYSPKKVEQKVKIGSLEVKQTVRKVVPRSNAQIDGIIIDTVSELSKKYQRSLLNQEGMMQMKDWGKLKNMRNHVKDAVYASATSQQCLDGLATVMKSLNAEELLNGGSTPLLEELNEVVIKPK